MATKVKFTKVAKESSLPATSDSEDQAGSLYFVTETGNIYLDGYNVRHKMTPEYKLTTEDNGLRFTAIKGEQTKSSYIDLGGIGGTDYAIGGNLGVTENSTVYIEKNIDAGLTDLNKNDHTVMVNSEYLPLTSSNSTTGTVIVGGNGAQPNLSEGTNATIVGANTSFSATNNTVVGTQASATGDNASAIGAQSEATGVNSVALGYNSKATDDDVISVGNNEESLLRRITGVFPATLDKDGLKPADADNSDSQNGTSLFDAVTRYDLEESRIHPGDGLAIEYDSTDYLAGEVLNPTGTNVTVTNSKLSVNYDNSTIGMNSNNQLAVIKDYADKSHTHTMDEIIGLPTVLSGSMSFAQMSDAVKSGYASSIIPVGTQILTKLDGNGYTVDEFAWDVVHHFDGSDDDHPLVTLADGSQVKGMMLQAHRTVPWGIVWQPVEAAIAVTGDMPAGTYHFTVTVTTAWGYGVAKAVGSTTYQFTTANDLKAGAQLVWNAGYSYIAALSKLTVYSGSASTAVVETCAVTAGNDGTDLGTMTDSTPSTNSQSYAALNNIERACEGSNRWKTSQMREALNCTGTVAQGGGSFSRPWQLVGKSGLPACLPDEFVQVLGEVERKQELHPWDGASTIETTHDTFFPISAREHGFNNYLSASSDGFKAEGVPLDYWTKLRTASGRTAWNGWSSYPELVTYDSVATTTARYVWLRSASRDGRGHFPYASCVGYVDANGAADDGGSAYASLFAAPACIIV